MLFVGATPKLVVDFSGGCQVFVDQGTRLAIALPGSDFLKIQQELQTVFRVDTHVIQEMIDVLNHRSGVGTQLSKGNIPGFLVSLQALEKFVSEHGEEIFPHDVFGLGCALIPRLNVLVDLREQIDHLGFISIPIQCWKSGTPKNRGSVCQFINKWKDRLNQKNDLELEYV